MSCSSIGGGGNNGDLRYTPRICKCGRKTIIKIIESKKPIKGKLYFLCNECGFVPWCQPSSGTIFGTRQSRYVEDGQAEMPTENSNSSNNLK